MKLQQIDKIDNVTHFIWTTDLSQSEWKGMNDSLNNSIEMCQEESTYLKGARQLQKIIDQYGFEALDAYHHSALILKKELKLVILDQAYQFIKNKLVEANFSSSDKIDYGFLPNRPFHRIIHHLATCYIDQNNQTNEFSPDIIELLELAVNSNPNDNLGCRYLLIWEYIRIKEYDKAIKLSDKYNKKGYTDDELLFAAGLAQLKIGDKQKSTTCFKKAKNENPLFALLILQHKESMAKYLPLVNNRERLISGSLDEALDLYSRTFSLWEQHLDYKSNQHDRMFLFNALSIFK